MPKPLKVEKTSGVKDSPCNINLLALIIDTPATFECSTHTKHGWPLQYSYKVPTTQIIPKIHAVSPYLGAITTHTLTQHIMTTQCE